MSTATNYFVLVTNELPLVERFVPFDDTDEASIAAAWAIVEEVRAHADNPARWCYVAAWEPRRLPRGPWGTALRVGH